MSFGTWTLQNVKSAGAKGDNTADDTAAIQAAIDAAHAFATIASPWGGAAVYLPSGIYRVSTSLMLYPNTALVGDCGGNPNHSPATIVATSGFAAPVGETGTPCVIRAKDRTVSNLGIRLVGITVDVSLFVGAIVGVDCSLMTNSHFEHVAVEGTAPGTTLGSGRVGFKVTDDNGAITTTGVGSGHTYFNTFLDCSVTYMETGFYFKTGTTAGTATILVMTSTLTGMCTPIVLESHTSSMGITFIQGYLSPRGLPIDSGCKAISYVGDAKQYVDLDFHNVEIETFPSPPDFNIINQTILAIFGYPEPVSVATIDGMVASRAQRRIIIGNRDTPGLGETSATPIGPNVTHGCDSLCFWAKIPSGTVLTQGVANTFRYFTGVGANGAAAIPDLVPDIKTPRAMGGLVQPVFFAATSLFTTAAWSGGVNWMAYDVSVYVGTTFTLTSDLVFFIDTMQPAAHGNFNRSTGGYD